MQTRRATTYLVRPLSAVLREASRNGLDVHGVNRLRGWSPDGGFVCPKLRSGTIPSRSVFCWDCLNPSSADKPQSQRHLAAELGIALGLAQRLSQALCPEGAGQDATRTGPPLRLLFDSARLRREVAPHGRVSVLLAGFLPPSQIRNPTDIGGCARLRIIRASCWPADPIWRKSPSFARWKAGST